MSEGELGSVEANGIRFRFLEEGRGPLVLCLHGFPDTAHAWDLLLPELAAAGYHAVAPFLRGYAPTASPSSGDYSMLRLGEDVIALIEALGESSAIVIGHDWGALAAYMAAGLAPTKVTKLITIAIPHPRSISPGPTFVRRSWHFFFYGLVPFVPSWLLRRKRGWGSVASVYARWSPGWSQPASDLATVERTFEQGVSGPLGYYRSFAWDQIAGALRLSARGRRARAVAFAKTSVPTLTILGKNDGALGIEDPERTREAFTGPYELLLLDAGHFVPREKPRELNDAVLKFLAT